VTDPDPTLTEVDTAEKPVAVKRRKAPMLLASAAAVALVISGAAYAGYNLVFGGPQPAERVPASAFAYVSVDFSPGLDQTRKLVELSKKLPQAGGAENPKEGLEKALTNDSDLKGVDFKRDLSAWLGNRVAVAAWSDAHHDVYGLLALQSKDDKAAAAGLARIKDAAKGEFGYTLRDGYALAAFGGKDAQAAADAAAAEAQTAPLSASAKYAEARDWLKDDQVAVFYADYDGLGQVVDAMAELSQADAAEVAEAKKQLPTGTMVAGVRAESDGLTVKYHGFGGKPKAGSPTDALAKLGALPSGTSLGVVARLPDDLTASPMFLGLPFLFATGGFAGEGLEVDGSDLGSGLTPAEEEEYDTLLEKEITGKLTKAEQKRFDELENKMSDAFDGFGPGGKPLTKAEGEELDRLMEKQNPTAADRKRMAELLGIPEAAMGPGGSGIGDTKEFEEMFGALNGGLLSVAVSDLAGDSPSFRAIVELAKAPDAAKTQQWSELFGKQATVKVEGSSITVQSEKFSGTGKLADDPLFRRASAGATGKDAQMALYVDLTRTVGAAQKKDLGPVQAVFVSGSTVSGTARILIG
jgi:hypothetical protein